MRMIFVLLPLIFTSVLCQADEYDVMVQSKSVNDYLEKSKSYFTANDLEAIQNYAGSFLDTPMKVSKQNNGFMMQVGSASAHFAFESAPGGAQIVKVNQKTLTFQKSESIQDVLKGIRAALPKITAQTSLWLPTAEAVDLQSAWDAIAAMGTAASKRFIEILHCEDVTAFEKACANPKHKFTYNHLVCLSDFCKRAIVRTTILKESFTFDIESFNAAAEILMSFEGTIPKCQDKVPQIKTCLKEKLKDAAIRADVAKYLGLPPPDYSKYPVPQVIPQSEAPGAVKDN